MVSKSHLFTTLFLILFLSFSSANAWLRPNFYAKTCPNLQSIVRSVLKPAIAKEKRLGASLIRLHFHDCFVNGCDGSVLLDDTATFTGEQTAIQNNNSIRGMDTIDAIKTQVEASCKGVVSCADILALAARDGSVLLKGPSWTVPLGRRDARTASLTDATNDLPLASMNLSALISNFAAKGLSAKEMTILSGSHTVGLARCVTFRTHIYNETNIDSEFAATRRATCPFTTGNDNLAPMDVQTAERFDNKYYSNLIAQRGLLHSDQVLYDGGSQDEVVKTYSKDTSAFFKDFADAMVKMGNISPLTGTKGEIRTNCGVVN